VKRWLKRLGIVLLAFLLVLAGVLAWALNSEAGAGFVLARAQGVLDGKLSVEHHRGSLAGPLVLEGLRWNDPASGVDARIGRVSLDLRIGALFAWRVQVDDLAIDDVDLALTTMPPKDEPSPPFSLDAPIDIVVDRLALQRANIRQDGEPVFTADRLELAAAWLRNGIAVNHLRLRAADGEVDLKGTLATLGGWSGAGETRFRWRIGETEYTGTLDATSDGRRASIRFILAAPFAANLDATLGQDDALPWTLKLDAPAFDPKVLAKDSGLTQVALALEGSGDRARGTLGGMVTLDAHKIAIDPLRFALADELLTIEALTLRSPDAGGSLDAHGEVHLDETPPRAMLTLAWQGVELPADLVGQALATHGTLDVSGSAAHYAADGTLTIGPPGQPADLRLKLSGTPERIALETLALVQPKGGLDATGTVMLAPTIGWQIAAQAKALDPGAFAAGWPGALDFDVTTRGRLVDHGIEATLAIERLAGTLRERRVSGKADLAIKPGYIVDGTLDLAAGGSTLNLRGRDGDATDVDARFAVATLGDWLPDAGGRADGRLRLHGRWPALDVEANAQARDLTHGDLRVSSLDLVVNLSNLEKPAGALTLKANGVNQGTARFDSVAIEANGNEGAHELAVDAVGTPASLRLSLAGSARDGRWNGSLKSLELDPRQRTLPDFALDAPMALTWDGTRFGAEQRCLVGTLARRANTAPTRTSGADADAVAREATVEREPARLCIGGEGFADGRLDARYSLEHLPLRLFMRLAAPDAPVRLRGMLGGAGHIVRDANGTLTGTATLASAEGSLHHEGNNDALLSYTGFVADARFGPQSTTATLHATFDHDGRLDGRVALSGAAGAPQALDGEIELVLKRLAFIELLTSEVANPQGRLVASYRIGGNSAEPELRGAFTLEDFATEVPAAGLRLHDGHIDLRAVDAQRFVLEGGITSGEGRLSFDGEGGLAADAPMKLRIKGENILAADIPAARVLINPDLAIERGAGGFVVDGKVGVPSARVDLAKLPGGGAASTSADVVIVDAQREQAGKRPPITASVTVVLGDDVKLAGFGFDGKLDGRLVVNERPGRATTGTGTLDVSGTYKAYGQNLGIETGRILFAGTPIDNPGLDIRASRRIEADQVSAGLLVRGTARLPVLTVYADPAMEQSDALAYLVTGKPLSALKSGEGDMLGTAARALGTAGGDLLAKSIGGRLGVDDIGVSDNAALGGAAFTVGKYLSPKLYLSYGVGIFEPGEVVTLRYLFHRRWNFEAQNATTGSRAGINYRYER